VKAVSSKVQVLPLMCQRYNAALGLLLKSSFGPRSNLSLRSCFRRRIGCKKYGLLAAMLLFTHVCLHTV